MASVYFENLNFFRDLVSGSSSTADPRLTCSVANEASESDTTICTRIRPLSVDEEEAGHIAGVVVTTPSQAALFEPRRKVNGAPGANVSLISIFISNIHSCLP
jgi:kinesin family protein 2/24